MRRHRSQITTRPSRARVTKFKGTVLWQPLQRPCWIATIPTPPSCAAIPSYLFSRRDSTAAARAARVETRSPISASSPARADS